MSAPRKMTPIRSWVASGLRCAIVMSPLPPAINGYVQVPSITGDQAEQVSAHGGVTYGPDSEGWIGFDTLHAGDLWPGSSLNMGYGSDEWGTNWTEELVAEATERMAASAKAVVEQ